MNEHREHYRDRALDLALEERVGGQTPPDLSAKILAAAQESPQPMRRERRGSSTRSHVFAYAGSVGVLLAGLAVVLLWQPDVQTELADARSAQFRREFKEDLQHHLNHATEMEFPDVSGNYHTLPPNILAGLSQRRKKYLSPDGTTVQLPTFGALESDGKPLQAHSLLSDMYGRNPQDSLNQGGGSAFVPSYNMGLPRAIRDAYGATYDKADLQNMFLNSGMRNDFNFDIDSQKLLITEALTLNDRRLEELEGRPEPRELIAEAYTPIHENAFTPVKGEAAVSTFSVDVDTASYSNVRRFLTSGALPPPDAVRIEELINYFHYDYPQPMGDEPFSASMELADCPWNAKHQLLRVGLKGREIPAKQRPAANLVFLIDVSGSMSDYNKLPLVQSAMKLLVGELREDDRVAIVVYAGAAGLVLDATAGDKTLEIRDAIDRLKAGGSTNGAQGIVLAYEKALANFIDGGINRVILATDGDLNVGVTEDEALVELIKEKASHDVFLTVLGFGTGNLKDTKLEKLADNGNGSYAYIDNLKEARKVLVEQIGGSLITIAKDVKLQLEFNPAEVRAYRLIGYENRILAARDFDDDTKDAGEIGAGHTVTALYELVPAGSDEKLPGEEENAAKAEQSLKYQQVEQNAVGQDDAAPPVKLTEAARQGELLSLALRYKQPEGDESTKLEFTQSAKSQAFNKASRDLQFAAAVASFGMLLRNSQHSGDATFASVEEIATAAIGDDPKGRRQEFVDLVQAAESLSEGKR